MVEPDYVCRGMETLLIGISGGESDMGVRGRGSRPLSPAGGWDASIYLLIYNDKTREAAAECHFANGTVRKTNC